MAVKIPVGVRNALLSTIAARADAGSGAAQLRVYSGSQPASSDDAPTGTLLLTFTLADPAFNPPTNGTMTLANATPIVGTAVTAGTVGWARLVDSTGVTVLDGSIGTANADFIISNATLTVGHSVVLTAALSMA